MEPLASWVLTYLIHSTLFLLAAAALSPLVRRRPEIASPMWKAALLGGIVTASLQVVGGVQPLSTTVALNTPTTAAVEAVPAADVPPTSFALAAVTLLPNSVAADAAATATASPVQATPIPTVREVEPTFTPVAAAEPPAAASRWLGWLAVLPIAGLAFAMLSIASGLNGLRRRLRGRVQVHDGRLAQLLRSLLRQSGSARQVGLYVAPDVSVPMATGILSSQIVVPRRVAAEMPAAHQETLLAHELAHVLRRDPAWRIVALVVERALFFQPLNRLATRGMAQSAEYLCDDWAARNTQRPLDLAQCLTEVAGWTLGKGTVVAPAVVGAGSRSVLASRVQRLLDAGRASKRSGHAQRLAASAAVLSIVAIAWLAPGVATGEGRANPPVPPVPPVPTVAALTLDEDSISIVATDEDGERVELRISDGEVSIVGHGAPAVAPDAPASAGRKQKRKAKRKAAKRRRKAQKEVSRAFRIARKQGRAAPDADEVAAILRRAEPAVAPRAPESFELRIVVPEDGEPSFIFRHDGQGESIEEQAEKIQRRVEQATERALRERGEVLRHQDKALRQQEKAMRQLERQLRKSGAFGEAEQRALREFLRQSGDTWPIAVAPPAPPARVRGVRAPRPPRPARPARPPRARPRPPQRMAPPAPPAPPSQPSIISI